MIKWAYILIGDNNTGKTIFQKELIQYVNGSWYVKLSCNQVFDVNIRIATRNAKNISFMNRSYQEKQTCYISVQGFFASHFEDADIAILASHLCQTDIADMIQELKKRFYNVCGVFFENSIAKNSSQNSVISSLPDWDERYYVENPETDIEDNYNHMLRKSALEFAFHILNKI
jgi:hypothetical protein